MNSNPGQAGAGGPGHEPHGSQGAPSPRGGGTAEPGTGSDSRDAGAAGLGPHYKWIALSNTTLGVLMATVNQSIV
ncbi:MAG: hypothetical protein ACRDOE_10060, partial [Streptosporangiaceae bacterium]